MCPEIVFTQPRYTVRGEGRETRIDNPSQSTELGSDALKLLQGFQQPTLPMFPPYFQVRCSTPSLRFLSPLNKGRTSKERLASWSSLHRGRGSEAVERGEGEPLEGYSFEFATGHRAGTIYVKL